MVFRSVSEHQRANISTAQAYKWHRNLHSDSVQYIPVREFQFPTLAIATCFHISNSEGLPHSKYWALKPYSDYCVCVVSIKKTTK